jgi:hypothetical protein
MGLLPFSLARPFTPGGRVRSHSRPPGVFPAWARGSFRGVVSGTTHRGLPNPDARCSTSRPPRGPWVCIYLHPPGVHGRPAVARD